MGLARKLERQQKKREYEEFRKLHREKREEQRENPPEDQRRILGKPPTFAQWLQVTDKLRKIAAVAKPGTNPLKPPVPEDLSWDENDTLREMEKVPTVPLVSP